MPRRRIDGRAVERCYHCTRGEELDLRTDHVQWYSPWTTTSNARMIRTTHSCDSKMLCGLWSHVRGGFLNGNVRVPGAGRLPSGGICFRPLLLVALFPLELCTERHGVPPHIRVPWTFFVWVSAFPYHRPSEKQDTLLYQLGEQTTTNCISQW